MPKIIKVKESEFGVLHCCIGQEIEDATEDAACAAKWLSDKLKEGGYVLQGTDILPTGYSIEKAKEGAFKGRYIVRWNGERLANCGSRREAENAVQWYVQRGAALLPKK